MGVSLLLGPGGSLFLRDWRPGGRGVVVCRCMGVYALGH